MFKVINNPNAVIDDLATAYGKIEKFEVSLSNDEISNRDMAVELQQQSLSGESKAEAKLTKLNADIVAISLKKQACERGKKQIRERIAMLIPDEIQRRMAELEQSYISLRTHESDEYKKFFQLCADAIVQREKIQGIQMYISSSGDLKEAAPELNVTAWNHMEIEDSAFLVECIQKARGNNDDTPSIKQQLDEIRSELEALRKIMTGDTDVEVDKIIEKYR